MKWKLIVFAFFLALFFVGFFIRNGGVSFNLPKPAATQLTNNTAYLGVCKQVLSNPEMFQQFKRHPIYNLFYENVSFEEGVEILNLLKKEDPEILKPKLLEKIRRIDCIGGPCVFTYEPIGPFSPTTLSYLKIATDLKKMLGPKEKLRIIEIGGGNGGLCKVLHEVLDIEQYTIIELEESLELAEKHLRALDIKRVQFMRPQDVKIEPCDLLISQNGFSESSQTLQKKYIKKLFSSAQSGYILCSFYPKYYRVQALKKQDLLKCLQKEKLKVEMHPEIPRTGKSNFVLTWTT